MYRYVNDSLPQILTVEGNALQLGSNAYGFWFHKKIYFFFKCQDVHIETFV